MLEGDINLALIYYAKTGNLEKVESCMEEWEADVNYSHRHFGTPLAIAAQHGQTRIIKRLLEDKACKINLLDRFNETPLHHAIKQGHNKCAELLLAHPEIDLRIQSYLLGTAVTAAVFLQRDEIANKILDKESEVTQLTHPGAFKCAIQKDKAAIIKKMMDKGMNPNLVGDQGYQQPQISEEELLKCKQASPFFNFSAKPLFELPVIIALESKANTVLPLFIEKNVNLYQIGKQGKSAIDYYQNDFISDEAKHEIENYQRRQSVKSTGGASSQFFVVSKMQNQTTTNFQKDISLPNFSENNTLSGDFSRSLSMDSPQRVYEMLNIYLAWLKNQPVTQQANGIAVFKEIFREQGFVVDIHPPTSPTLKSS